MSPGFCRPAGGCEIDYAPAGCVDTSKVCDHYDSACKQSRYDACSSGTLVKCTAADANRIDWDGTATGSDPTHTLQHKGITGFAPGAFSEGCCGQVEMLHLGGNKIKALAKDALVGLASLTVLDLSGNQIKTVAGLTTLTRYSISRSVVLILGLRRHWS